VVRASALAGSSEGFEVVLVSGMLVRVPATFDGAALGRLLAVLQSAGE
jgi:hypothetical protein